MRRFGPTGLALGLFVIGLLLAAMGLAMADSRAATVDRLRAGNLKGCPGCNLFQANLGYTRLPDADFSNANLTQADFTVAVMPRANFSGAMLAHANMYGVVATRANFSRADLTRVTLVGSWLVGASFAGAKLNETNLSGANLSEARGLTQSQLNAACGDAQTRLPSGLSIPRC
jgi:uncharacterized protein YjbI with pentapeptide repeats